MVFTVTFDNITEIIPGLVSPAALSESEGEFRRDITPSYHAAELLYDIIRRVPFYNIKGQIRVLTAYSERIRSGVTDVKCDRGRMIKKQAEIFCSCYDDEVVCCIQ